MADDITLTVRVRDLAQGDFNRLDRRLDGLRRNLRSVSSASSGTNNSLQRMETSLGEVQQRMQRLQSTGQLTRREFTHMQRTFGLLSREALQASRTGALTRDQYRNLRNEINRTRIDFDALTRDINLHNVVMRNTGDEAERLRQRQERLRQSAERLRLQDERLRQSAARLGQTRTSGTRTLRVRVHDGTAPFFNGFQRRLADMQNRLRRLDADSPFRRLITPIRGFRAGLLHAQRGVNLLTIALWGMARVLHVNQRWTAILIATLVLLGPAAAALGALLITALGGAFIALGAFALRGNAQVKAAFDSMKTTVGGVVRDSAASLEGPLVGAMNQVAQAAVGMSPLLSHAFDAVGPLIEDMFGAITDLTAQALPGFTAALQNSESATAGFRQAMGLVGQGLGDMFKIMTEGNEDELLRIWQVLGTELNNFLINIGQFVSTALNSETAVGLLVTVFRAFGGALNTVAAMLQTVDGAVGSLFSKITNGVSAIDKLTTGANAVSEGFAGTTKPVKELEKDLKSVEAQIEQVNKARGLLAGPAKEHVKSSEGKTLNQLLQEKASLEAAISAATLNTASADTAAASAVRDRINAIRELNNLNQSTLDARSAMEKAIDDATAKTKEHVGALKFVGGQLNLNSQAARDAYEPFARIAETTRAATQAAIEQKAPWSQIQAIWQRGQGELIRYGASIKMTAGDSRLLADSILSVPDLQILMQANITDLEAKIATAKAELGKVPPSKQAEIRATIAQLEIALATAREQLAALDGTTANTYVNTYITTNRTERVFTARMKYKADADGSIHNMQRFANGGESHHAQVSRGTLRLWGEPETQGEAYIPLAETKRTRSMNILKDVAQKFGYRLEKFASGGVSEILGSMNISPQWKQAGTKLSPFRKSLAVPGDVSSLISAINNWRDKIKKATSGNTEKRLVNALGKTGAFLIKHQIALTKMTAAIDKAKDKLHDLREKASQLRDSVTDNIVQSGNITGATTAGKPTTVANIMDNLISQKGKAVEFAAMLKALQKRGLGGQAISEIAQAGIDGGGFETAKALMQASPNDLKQINAAQKEIAKAASIAGKTAADAMYTAAIKAADALVKALQKKASKIAASMLNAVVALEKAIRRALGKKATGGVVGAAGGGPRSRMTLVGEHGPEIVDLAAGSMVRSNPDTRRLLANSFSGGGGGGVIQANIILDGRVAARALIDPLRGEIRDKGGNVQNVLGQRGK